MIVTCCFCTFFWGEELL